MSEARSKGMVLRRVGAVGAGLVAIFVLSMGTDGILHATGVYPPVGVRMSDGLFALATAYRIVYGIFGCWLAARLAPDRPYHHAWALALIGVVFSTAGTVAMWKAGPPWYSLGVIAMNPLCAWLGGRFAARPALA
ncbi:MAG: hypothetical protein JWP91_1340 [Fibrobacteres bacterium]|nr:hypothetical protein [Fibrobacterota bacterium]